MADLQIVMEVVGQTSIETASNNLQKLEGRINKLSKALDSGRIDNQQFVTGLKEIRRTVDSQFSSWQKAKASIDGYVKATKAAQQNQEKLKLIQKGLEQDLKMAGDAAEYQNKKLLGISTTYKSASSSASAFSGLLKQQDQELKMAADAAEYQNKKLLGISTTYKSASSSASVFSELIKQQDQELKMAADAAEYQNKKLLGISTTYKSASSSASAFSTLLKQQEQDQKDAAVASQRLESEVDQLRLKYDSVYSSSKIYERSLNELNRALKINAISTDIYQKEVDQLNNEFQQFQAGTTNLQNRFVRFDTSMQTSGKAARRFQLGVQQAGYQVGDFFTQIASGANPMVAFTQQATQLAGFFAGPWGAAIGAALSIVGALGVVFLATRDKTNSFKEALDSLKDKTKEVTQETEFLLSGLKDVEEFLITKEITLLTKELSALEAELNNVNSVEIESFSNLQREVDKLRAKLNIATTALEDFRAAREEVDDIKSTEVYKEINRDLTNQNSLLRLQVGPSRDLILYATTKRMIEEQNLILRAKEKGLTEEQIDALVRLLNLNQNLTEDLEEQVEQQKKQETMLQNAEKISKQIAENFERAAKVRFDNLENLDLKRLELKLLQSGAGGAEIAGALSAKQAQSAEYQRQVSLGAEPETAESAASKAAEEARKYAQEIFKLNEAISNFTRTGSVAQESNLERLRKQLDLEQELIGKTDAQKRVLQALGDERNKYSKSTIDGLIKTIDLIQTENDKIAQQQAIAQSIESAMESAFMSMVDGTKSVKDAFKDMARAIIADLYKMFVVKQITGFVTGSVSNFMAGPVQGPSLPSSVQANGGAWSGGNIIPFANGGIVGGPTNFPMSGGRTGLMGEAGPEAIMPLKRGPNGKLGVEAQGSGGIVINQSFNFSANGDESVKRIIAKEAPRIAQMTQQQIMDSRRRGGTMKATFG